MKKELKYKRFTIYDPIFKQKIVVFINGKPEQFARFEKKLGVVNSEPLDPNLWAFSTHISGDNEPNTYIIWLNHFDWTLDDQESLVHEIIHTVVRIWEANNIVFSVHTQEFYAHSVGRLYAMIGRKINW